MRNRVGWIVATVMALIAALVVAVMAAPAAGASLALQGFGARTDYVVGENPLAMTSGDLNADGAVDLIVPNGSADTVSVLIGNGDGTFAPKVDYATGDAPVGVAVGDLNGDARLDVITSNSLSDNVSVLLGNGDGTLGAKTDVAVGTGPGGVAVGDLNNDSKLDVVVGEGTSETVSILLGNGSGTFAPRMFFASPSPMNVATGYLNGDAVLDVVVTSWYGDPVTVYLGNGNGTFGAGTAYATSSQPGGVVVGDLNGDGKSDLVVANQSDGTAAVWLGNGNGTFAAKPDVVPAQPGQAPSVALSDINGDSVLDVALTEAHISSGTVSVSLGVGDGTFASEMSYDVVRSPSAVVAARLNGDTLPDLAVAGIADPDHAVYGVSVLLNTGPATVPGAPAIGVVTAANTTATVSWTAPASNGGLRITGYVITPYIGAVAQPPHTFDASATTRTISGLANGTTYTFTVAATNSLGSGPQSDASAPVTVAPVLPSAPTIIRNATAANESATISWNAPVSDGGSAITGYVVTPYIWLFVQPSIVINSTATTAVITGLTNGTTYRFKVAAINSVGTGPTSKVTNPVTPAPTVPSAPVILRTATAGNGRATVSWLPPATDGGSAITGYIVTPYVWYWEGLPRIFDSTATTQVVTGLTNGWTYRFRVQAVNAIGVSGYSKVTNPVTPSAEPT